jgi:hypothetical protein
MYVMPRTNDGCPSFAFAANTDEGASFGKKRLNTTQDLINALKLDHPHMTNLSINRLLELYPDDPYYGCPFNTGDAYLSSGRQDKRSNAIWGDTRMQAGVSSSLSLLTNTR